MIVRERLETLVKELDDLEKQAHEAKGLKFARDLVHWQLRKKFYAIDIGSSGAYLVEVLTGEIYNISGYGRPDYNKKKKADIGNIMQVNPQQMYLKRYNYLR